MKNLAYYIKAKQKRFTKHLYIRYDSLKVDKDPSGIAQLNCERKNSRYGVNCYIANEDGSALDYDCLGRLKVDYFMHMICYPYESYKILSIGLVKGFSLKEYNMYLPK
jgi:hypothetical protein